MSNNILIPSVLQCSCSQDRLVKPGVYSQTMRITPGPADPLQRRFEAFLPLGRRRARGSINTRGVRPNTLADSQSGQAAASFAVFVCVYVCRRKVGSLQKSEEMKVCTEQGLAVHFAFVGIIRPLHIDPNGTRPLRRGPRWSVGAALLGAGSRRLCLRHTLQRLAKSSPNVSACVCAFANSRVIFTHPPCCSPPSLQKKEL